MTFLTVLWMVVTIPVIVGYFIGAAKAGKDIVEAFLIAIGIGAVGLGLALSGSLSMLIAAIGLIGKLLAILTVYVGIIIFSVRLSGKTFAEMWDAVGVCLEKIDDEWRQQQVEKRKKKAEDEEITKVVADTLAAIKKSPEAEEQTNDEKDEPTGEERKPPPEETGSCK